MVTNTVQTLIDYTKDLSGQSNATTAKIIRALNFGVDSLSTISLIASGRNKNDSRNHGDVSRVTTSVTAGTTKLMLETELATIQQMDILVDGKYVRVEPIDRRDNERVPLDNTYGTGRPKYYDVEAGYAYLYPVPDTTYTIRLTYGRPHPRFTADNLTQETGVMPLHEEYLALFAADRLMIGSNDPSRAQVRNELERVRMDVVDLFKLQDQDRPMRLKPNLDSAFSSRFNSLRARN